MKEKDKSKEDKFIDKKEFNSISKRKLRFTWIIVSILLVSIVTYAIVNNFISDKSDMKPEPNIISNSTETIEENESPEKAELFKLTEKSYERLKDDGLPENLINQLKNLQNKSYTKEDDFLKSIKKQLALNKLIRINQIF